MPLPPPAFLEPTEFSLPRNRSIVDEVTDDKSLPKEERKARQVSGAPHKSKEAKLVKLADKLYNLRDLNRCTPRGKCCCAILRS